MLYVSLYYGTAVHLCMCGCGYEVTNPLSPQQWRLIFDGRHVSLTESVGNWSFECESHYWLEGGAVVWEPSWSRRRIASGRKATRRRIDESFNATSVPHQSAGPVTRRAPWVRRICSAIGRRP
ncbi:DUF6527 family protein [Williamsia maris]|uniref:DUF6527 family protein n=1 Tax=Williamsia maris TaxID=72806 RepID=UPI0035592EA1